MICCTFIFILDAFFFLFPSFFLSDSLDLSISLLHTATSEWLAVKKQSVPLLFTSLQKLYYSSPICQSQRGNDWNHDFEASSFQYSVAKRRSALMLTEPWTKVLILCLPPAVPPHHIINHRGVWKLRSTEPGWRPGVSRWWPLQPISPWLVSLFWHCCEGGSFWCYWFGRRAKERRDRCTCWFSGVANSGQLHSPDRTRVCVCVFIEYKYTRVCDSSSVHVFVHCPVNTLSHCDIC